MGGVAVFSMKNPTVLGWGLKEYCREELEIGRGEREAVDKCLTLRAALGEVMLGEI